MGLAEPSLVAPGSKGARDEGVNSSSSPLPVSSLSGVLGATEKRAKATSTTSTIDLDNDSSSWRGRRDASVGRDPLAAAASAASTMISETAHRAAELTLGAVAPGTTTEDVVRASREGLLSAFTAARALASSAVAAAAASASEVSAAAASAAAAASQAVEAARASNGAAAALSVDDYTPRDGATVLGAFACELRDEVSSRLFGESSRRIAGALYVTSTAAVFVVSKAQHQALGRAVARAVSSAAAEEALASASAVGSASTDLVGFVGASLAAEEARDAAWEAEANAGLPRAGAEVSLPLSEIGEGGASVEADEGGNELVVATTSGKRAVFASFGAPSDADEALALLEHVKGEGK